MAVPYGNRAPPGYETSDYETSSPKNAPVTGRTSVGSRGRFQGALKAALMIGSIIALFVALSLIRPMREENVPASQQPASQH